MKKSLLLISAITMGLSSYAQYEGFENWTTSSLQKLGNYGTTVDNAGLEGQNAIYPVNDAVTGTKSVKLETVVASNGDTIFGYIMSGDFDTQAPGQPVTLTGPVDSLIGYYKCNIQPNDSALIMCLTSLASVSTGGGTMYFTTSQPNWTRFALPLNALSADSILLVAVSSDAINDQNGIPGTWIQFDYIQLKGTSGTQNVENYSFENWSATTWEIPNLWETSASFAIGEPILPAIKSTDMYSGNFAIELNTIQNQNGDTIAGIATNGGFNETGVFGGKPYTFNPSGLEFYYKNSVIGIDTGFVSINFKNNGTVIAQYGLALTPTGSYTQISQAVSLPTSPDSVLITAFSGKNPGSSLNIDHINFVFPVGVTENLTVEKIVSYPNPTTDKLNIRFNIAMNNDVTVRLIDITGKELNSKNFGNLSAGTYDESFNTSSYSSGVYFIEFTLGNEKIVSRFIVK